MRECLFQLRSPLSIPSLPPPRRHACTIIFSSFVSTTEVQPRIGMDHDTTLQKLWEDAHAWRVEHCVAHSLAAATCQPSARSAETLAAAVKSSLPWVGGGGGATTGLGPCSAGSSPGPRGGVSASPTLLPPAAGGALSDGEEVAPSGAAGGSRPSSVSRRLWTSSASPVRSMAASAGPRADCDRFSSRWDGGGDGPGPVEVGRAPAVEQAREMFRSLRSLTVPQRYVFSFVRERGSI